MIFIFYTLHLIITVSSFRWLNNASGDNAKNPPSYSLPKYDARIEDFPHHVLIYFARLYCSGSLVSSRAIVTCAACFYLRAGETVFVKVGTRHYLDSKMQRMRVADVRVHEFYRRLTPVDNDIALIFLERNVRFSTSVKKIPLAEPEVSLQYGQALLVSGYGADNVHARLKNQLLATFLIVSNNSVCEEAFGKIMTHSTYCAKLYFSEQRLSDNGGGASFHDLLVGVLVAGANTDNPNAAIFTNVSYFHRWIVLNTQRFHEQYCNRTTLYDDVASSYESYEGEDDHEFSTQNKQSDKEKVLSSILQSK